MARQLLLAAYVFGFALPLLAQEGPSAQLGKILFQSPDLGSNGHSCSTCHPQGEGIASVGLASNEELSALINRCIQDALQGAPLAAGTQELDSLMLYLRSLAEQPR